MRRAAPDSVFHLFPRRGRALEVLIAETHGNVLSPSYTRYSAEDRADPDELVSDSVANTHAHTLGVGDINLQVKAH